MLLALLRLGVALALLVVVPGALLLNALLPPHRSRLTRVERAYLSLAGGALLLMLVGVVLGMLPHGSTGWFGSLATGGFPHLELALLAVSIGLFYVGLRRGAYPGLVARWPALRGLAPSGSAPRAAPQTQIR